MFVLKGTNTLMKLTAIHIFKKNQATWKVISIIDVYFRKKNTVWIQVECPEFGKWCHEIGLKTASVPEPALRFLTKNIFDNI